MLYIVTAYKYATPIDVKSREVRGFDNAEAQQKIWEAQGYECNITMQCTKYIAVEKVKAELHS